MTLPSEPLNAAETLVEPGPSGPAASKRQIWAYIAGYVGAYLILIVPFASTLAIKIGEIAPETRAEALGVISALGALAALISNPIVGALSDRTTSRFGMRRPWIIGGTFVGTAALMVLAFTSSVLVVGISWVIVQLAINAATSGLAAFLPDRVPEEQRGRVSALTGIAQQLTPFVGLLIANVALGLGGGTASMFVVPSAIGVAMVALYAILAKDRVLSPNLRQPMRWSTIFKAFTFNPRQNPDFGWAWLGRFFICLAFAANNTYQVYFLNDRLGIPLTQVATFQLGLLLLATVLMVVTAGISGRISDRYRRRKIFVFLASGLIAVSSIITAFAPNLEIYIVSAVISGIATGMYFAVDLALVTDVLPNKTTAAAKDMGVFNIANTLPQSIAPALAPLALAIGGVGTQNYAALFLCAAAAAIVGALTVIPIKKVR